MRVTLGHTQQQLADQAGVSRSTVHRMENGVGAVQMSSFIRVCRVLGTLPNLDAWLPRGDTPSPMDALRRGGRTRVRARAKEVTRGAWTWAV
jgi:DNA-binding XRE family transcriptional regulator